MTNEEKRIQEFKDKVLKLERESLSNIVKTDDKKMIDTIINMYKEEDNNDNK